MSSYRCSYAPWKTSLTPSYKSTGSSSAYSSRDDINAPRYTSLSSPSTYRPSLVGGTYRINRDRTPVTTVGSTYVSRYGTVNGNSLVTPKSSSTSKYGSSREPSPLALERTNRISSREPSPVSRPLKGKTRDPSPVIDSKSKLGYVGANSYRLSSSRASNYTPRYNASNSNLATPARTPQADKSISYLTASDAHERCLKNRAKVKASSSSSEKTTETESLDNRETSTTSTHTESNNATTNGSVSETDSDSETFVAVSVVTRATSPTPPSEKTVQRVRRIDIAKTLEKTIQRSTKRKQLHDKEIQSDRLDDSTRYSRFGLSTRVSSYSPHSDSSRYSNLRYSSSPLSSTCKSSASPRETRKEETTSNNNNNKNRTNNNKSKLSPPKVMRINSRQSSVENLICNANTASKPPAAPKSESPTKSTTPVSTTVNKDFRKSALNVGPTDRPRKSRTPSSGTDSDQQQQSTHAINEIATSGTVEQRRKERSPSAGSEASYTSCGSNRRGAGGVADKKLQLQVRQRCHNNKQNQNANNNATRNTTLMRNNSNISLKMNGHKSCTPSSSSGTDSAVENKKIIKKNAKKKASSSHTVSKLVTTTINNSNKSFAVTAVSTKSSAENSSSTPATISESESSARIKAKIVDSACKSNTAYNNGGNSSEQLKKLSTVSNFFVARQHETNNSTANFVESSESSVETVAQLHADACSLSLTADINTNNTTSKSRSPSDPDSGETNTNFSNNYNERAHSADTNAKRYTTCKETVDKITPDKDKSGDEMRFKLRHFDSGETAWWLRNDNNETAQGNGIEEDNKQKNIKQESNKGPRDYWSSENDNNNNNNENDPNEANYTTSIIANISGKEQAKQDADDTIQVTLTLPNSPNNLETKPLSDKKHWWLSGPEKKLFNISRIDSGEKAWWQEDNDEETAVTNNAQKNWHEKSADAEIEKIQINQNNNGTNNELNNSFYFEYSMRPPPLGQCASPVPHIEQLETEKTTTNHSTYDNIPTTTGTTNYNQQNTGYFSQHQHPYYHNQQHHQHNNNINACYNNLQQQQQRQAPKLFISRHENIDELLGGTCRPFREQTLYAGSAAGNSINYFIEEITPDQVRIHDSTAQMPTIMRMERDDGNQLIDDAALQVYKDGDYGAYLDLESTLAEQSEEIEGLNANRKNSLVVRTQLSVRVHAIIEKLLSSEGSDLRRALFALKQVFQEDKDLVHAFVALGGLNCLVRVGNVAEYQHYILRALGQVMLYVDGMHGVMKHAPTMQWLYSLIESNYRTVVKTALKLLLVFVEYAETNCYVLVNAIHAVDKSVGRMPWSNIMRLLKDYDNADAELVIYATSLINKTLAGLNDQDSFYDETDLLEQQGMEAVIQRYMSKPGTDVDLMDQLQLYEAVLKFEDGEAEGISVFASDSSIRKTQRHRLSDATERRKSRRHSTGTSPSVMKKVLPSTPISSMLAHNTLDEDSSGSTHSIECNGNVVLNHERNTLEEGLTPALRRRRERAERHKSFLKEQQEAATNGILVALEKREEMGQIVTAIPATVKTSDSPLESDQSVINNNRNNYNYKHNLHNHLQKQQELTSNKLIGKTTTTTTTTATSVNNNITMNMLSPTKQLMQGINSISIITNGFDKEQNNNNHNNNNNLVHLNNKSNSPNFLNKKNLLIEKNATVINGIMKNIQRGNNNDTSSTTTTATPTTPITPITVTPNAKENENVENINYKNYEHDANRLNNYYNQVLNNNNASIVGTPKKLSQQQQQHLENINTKQYENTIITNATTNQSPKKCLSPTFKSNLPKNLLRTSMQTSLSTANRPTTTTTTNENLRIMDVVNKELSPPTVSARSNDVPAFTPPPPPPPPPPPDLWGKTQGYQTTMPSVTHKQEYLQITDTETEDKTVIQQLKRDHTVKDLTQKLSTMPLSPTPSEDKTDVRLTCDMSGLISKAKEGLAKSKSKGEMSRSSSMDQEVKKSPEIKKSENELQWEEVIRNMTRPLQLCDLDFTDLTVEDEKDVLAPRSLGGGVPPPPPPICGIPPPMLCPQPAPPPMFSYSGYASLPNSAHSSMNGSLNGNDTIKKGKKTVKLFWKEVREDMITSNVKTIWDELLPATVDTQKLEHLFESRAKDLMSKKQHEINKSKEVIVLDHKRSNAINIAMTKLPPPRIIKAAILKMDQTIMTREGIDKLLNMLPTDEEKGRIQEAQLANPELPLGSAEQFLLTLASISELAARLKLWAFRLDFDNTEKEIAEPLMDLKQGIEILRNNHTFKCILSTLLSVGIFLNGASVKGFDIEYLQKVPEVKDTVHKHSLLHHLCHMVMETCTDTSDLYSEIGPITRASKADFADLAHNLNQLETECKSSWDRLKLIGKHDCPPQLKQKLVDFLADCAERIIILQMVHRRIINRYRKFLIWLGVPQHNIAESRPNELCRIVSEFALEYRTTRDRVQQQLEKKANHRERNKTRGKMITDVGKFKSKEDIADAELKELLGTQTADKSEGYLTWRRRRAEQQRSPLLRQSEENFTDGDDEILESLVKTATKAPGSRTTPRERKRTRHADLRRTLKNGLSEEEKQYVAAMIKSF